MGFQKKRQRRTGGYCDGGPEILNRTDSHLDLIRRRQNLAKLDQAVESAAAGNTPYHSPMPGSTIPQNRAQARKHPISAVVPLKRDENMTFQWVNLCAMAPS
jgi:hypothetical protein